MPYIVVDFEWNQAMSPKSSIFNRLPIKLRGEIIQIGAVKLSDGLTPADEFQMDIKPIYFRKMHHRVKKLTGFDSDRLNNGTSFCDALDEFRQWCGDDCTLLTWGYDDKNIMEQNIILHDKDWDWINKWINLQVIYNIQVAGNKNQTALSTAMEHFGIEQTRIAHDALGDAYNTALVCSMLDLETAMEKYDSAANRLSATPADCGDSDSVPLEHITSKGYFSRSVIFDDEAFLNAPCPLCGGKMEHSRWVNQGDNRYMTLAACPEHGSFLIRLKLRCTEDETWNANRIIYKADAEKEKYYRIKSASKRRTGRKREKKPAVHSPLSDT